MFQSEWRFPLADFEIRFRYAVPVDEYVGPGKFHTVGIGHRCCRTGLDVDASQGRDGRIALLEIALDFEIELLGEFARQSDAGAPQPEPVLQRIRTEPTFEGGDVTAFQIRLDITAQGQFIFRTGSLRVNRRR